MKSTGRKVGLVMMVGLMLLTLVSVGVESPVQAAEPVKPITIIGIIAKDKVGIDANGNKFGQEPDSYNSVSSMVNSPPSDRTGWSGYYSSCDASRIGQVDPITKEPLSPWVEEKRHSTDDSGRDKKYNVSDYRAQIVKDYGQEVYDQAVKSGGTLGYETGSKKEIYSKDYHPVPCTTGQGGFYYNNFDFTLTMTFTPEEDIPPPVIPPVQGRMCVPSTTLVSSSEDVRVYEIIKCETLGGSTPGETEGEVIWRLYKPSTTSNSAAKVTNGLYMSGKVQHFEVQAGSEKWTTKATGINPQVVFSAPAPYLNVNADGIKGQSILYMHEYNYTNDYKETFSRTDHRYCSGGWTTPKDEDEESRCRGYSWTTGPEISAGKEADWGRIKAHTHSENLLADHRRGEDENLGESTAKVDLIVGSSKEVRKAAVVQKESFSMAPRAKEDRDTQGTIEFVENPLVYTVDFMGEPWHHINKWGYYYAFEVDKNIQDKYKNTTDYSFQPYAIPVKLDTAQSMGNGYTVPIKSKDDFYTTRDTGFVFSVDNGVGSPESVAATEYKSFTGANYRDTVVNAPDKYKSSYYMPIDGNGEMKTDTQYTHTTRIGEMGLNDFTIQFDKSFSFKHYLIGSVFDDTWIAEQSDSLLDVTYPNSVTVTLEEGIRIKEASKNRTMLLHGFRVTDGKDFYDKVKLILGGNLN